MKEKETVLSFWLQGGFWAKASLVLVEKTCPPFLSLSCSASFCCSLLFFSLDIKISRLVYGGLFGLNKNHGNKTS